jgi:P27 family predicted phage terminase small subunit
MRGNPGKRPLNPHEPLPPPASLDPPDWLDEPAKAEWRRLAPLLSANGVLTTMDVDALCAYCETWVRWKDATAKLKQLGLIIKSPNGMLMPSPYLVIANQAMTTMRVLLTEFGMTPSSRVRVAAGKAKAEADDKWAGLDV